MKKTKIVATIGPASNNYAVMKKLAQAGMNVVRINLSHAKLKDMEIILKNVKKIKKELNIALPIMIDTRGPEIRVKTFMNDSAEIKKGQKFVFTTKDIVGDNTIVSLNEPSIIKSVKVGNKILAVNGLITFKVVEVTKTDIITKAMNSGVISNRKSLSIPGVKYVSSYLNDADKENIIWAIKNNVELIAASFVNCKEDVITLRNFITQNGGNLKIISKIESQCGVENLNEIIKVSDGIMVARGDLGVEVEMCKLPELQKTIIKKCIEFGKPVITATEMLESMISNNRPTRAEVSDVANAVYDGTNAIMLSGETASGKYPVEAVKTMAKIAKETENHINYFKRYENNKIESTSLTDVICNSAVGASFLNNIKAIVSFTDTGMSASSISRFRPNVNIIGATPNKLAYEQMQLLWGVTPMLTPIFNTTDEMFEIANNLVKANSIAKKNDLIIVTCGTPKKTGCTNLMKIIKVD